MVSLLLLVDCCYIEVYIRVQVLLSRKIRRNLGRENHLGWLLANLSALSQGRRLIPEVPLLLLNLYLLSIFLIL
jgi:hypothetical protein